MSPSRFLIQAFATASLLGLPAFGGPRVEVGRPVPRDQRVSLDEIEHQAWDALLRRYVDAQGLVDYASWKRQDVAALDAYLNELSTGSRTLPAPREARLAFWINAYNAVTIRGILREYPTTSIRNHTARLVGYNIWKDLLLHVDGAQHSLDAIEHDVLRPMGEPRIHFAIVCASIGCPKLLNRAYRPEALESQLQANAKAFFASPKHFQVEQRSVRLSPILDWFAQDFGRDQTAQLRTIAPLLPTDTARGRGPPSRCPGSLSEVRLEPQRPESMTSPPTYFAEIFRSSPLALVACLVLLAAAPMWAQSGSRNAGATRSRAAGSASRNTTAPSIRRSSGRRTGPAPRYACDARISPDRRCAP